MAGPRTTMIVYGDFEWSMRDAAANLAKHGITFKEAATVFADQSHVPATEGPSALEVVGVSARNRKLVVEHQRGPRIRILSARLERADKGQSKSAPAPAPAVVPPSPVVSAPPAAVEPAPAPKSERRPKASVARKSSPEGKMEPAPKSGVALRAVASKSEPPPRAERAARSAAASKSEPPASEPAPKSARTTKMSWRAAARVAMARLSG